MQRRHRRAHTVIWTGIAVVLPIMLVVIFASVPKLSADAPAVRLDATAAQGDSNP
ncbi:Hypothetical protein RG1141_CH44530 [Neorhizobium galegae bv. officinalis bv. officinalis str. HAMBI 1141]|jgi:hypothetical protein|uniref:Uncharacterized protein n=1 Tax=Neorhizobium galegae bv. officinalis bv. officinalis str. HAMBI 1141 TaxID=1028801 RepID=A0A068TH04_NEOGA|nr:hypothetical protein [Neorhizobium galegae]MCJ9751083.1 hypothetical protein [Neorhizobium sp. BETTINA12A]CDN56765.1 Hypothetical protein RG1141_CH44530 [Neorhizobium galegae bv. officinalis bv. officinalis str. HAMBI 1141]